jgi:hypothetical protein
MTAAAHSESLRQGAPDALRPLRGVDELALCDGRPIDRAAGLVAASAPGLDPDQLALGEFNRLLLRIHAVNWGEATDAVARCPAERCGVRMDVPLDFGAMLAAWPDAPPSAPVSVEIDGVRALLRPARVGDLRAALAAPGPAGPHATLMKRVMAGLAVADGVSPAPDALAGDPAALSAVEAALARADPFATLTVRGACPVCGLETPLAVEPMLFALAPLSDPETVLDEVDLIARAYHWSEAEILGLPIARRRAYLARIAAAAAAAGSGAARVGAAA